jgi:hypothetical protein
MMGLNIRGVRVMVVNIRNLNIRVFKVFLAKPV